MFYSVAASFVSLPCSLWMHVHVDACCISLAQEHVQYVGASKHLSFHLLHHIKSKAKIKCNS